MSLLKLSTFFIFFLTFVVCVSAQDKTMTITWKNLQEKYESFEDVKPVIVNNSNQPIYIDCTLNYFEKDLYGHTDNSYNTKLLMFDDEAKIWLWNVGICGTFSKKERRNLKNREKEIEQLQKEGKYGCRINPNEEYALNFDSSQWKILTDGDGIGPIYNSGKFKFEINYWWYNSQKNRGRQKLESSEFLLLKKN